MQSPPLEFSVMFGGPLLINLVRSFGDPDIDTICENVRTGVEWLEDRGLHGWLVLDVALVAGPLVFRKHMRKYLPH